LIIPQYLEQVLSNFNFRVKLGVFHISTLKISSKVFTIVLECGKLLVMPPLIFLLLLSGITLMVFHPQLPLERMMLLFFVCSLELSFNKFESLKMNLISTITVRKRTGEMLSRRCHCKMCFLIQKTSCPTFSQGILCLATRWILKLKFI